MRFIKIKSAQKIGHYKKTEVDQRKSLVAFRIVSIGKLSTIVWTKTGISENVTRAELKKLQNKHTWACDF